MGRRIGLMGGLAFYDNGGLNVGTGFPASGTAGTTVKGGRGASPGSMYMDTSSGVMFVNEGTAASPYWSPVTYDQRGLMGWYWDGRDGTGKANADTGATATLAGSGLRIHGDAVHETDSGFVVTMSDQGPVATIADTGATGEAVAISVGTGTTPVYQPDQNGTMVVDAVVSNLTAITNRSMFFGFCGSASDVLSEPCTGATSTISFATTFGDDVAGLFFDTGLTDADGWFAVHDKDNANASILTTATGVDIGVTVAAASTYQRLRVECDANGTVRMFVDKALEATFSAALEVTEEVQPVLVVAAQTTAVQSYLLKQFSTWGARV
jgi:hypothetical protein